MSVPSPWIQNEFFNISTPVQAPRRWRGFVWLAALVTCRKCGRQHTQALRIHQVQLPSFLSDVVIEKPMPSDEKIAAAFSLRTAENGAGCWRTCRPWKHMKACLCPGECACPRKVECSCPLGCGNKGVHPCQCGRMYAKVGGKHNRGCPTGEIERTSGFEVAYMRSQMTGPRGRK